MDRHTTSAPPRLRERVRWYADQAGPGDALPRALAAAGQSALDEAARHQGHRRAALDLLAADALITLALLAQAQLDPGALHAFASSLVMPGSMSR